MKKLLTPIVVILCILCTSCTSIGVRKPTSANVKSTQSATIVEMEAVSIQEHATDSKKLARVGAKETGEDFSRSRFETIGQHQTNIITSARTIENNAKIIIRTNKGEYHVSFTVRLLIGIGIVLLIMVILTYFGLDGLLRSVIKNLIARPLEDLLDTEAKIARSCSVDNKEFPEDIRKRMMK